MRNKFGVTVSKSRPFNAATVRNKFGVSSNLSKKFKQYDYGTPEERRRVRNQVMARDGYRCRKCGRDLRNVGKERHVHHVIPLSKGGSNSVANQKLLCVPCHELEHKHMDRTKKRKYR